MPRRRVDNIEHCLLPFLWNHITHHTNQADKLQTFFPRISSRRRGRLKPITATSGTSRRHCPVCCACSQARSSSVSCLQSLHPGQVVGIALSAALAARPGRRQCLVCKASVQDKSSAESLSRLQRLQPGQAGVVLVVSEAHLPRTKCRQSPVLSQAECIERGSGSLTTHR